MKRPAIAAQLTIRALETLFSILENVEILAILVRVRGPAYHSSSILNTATRQWHFPSRY
jgi:hypothetical protein